MRNFIQTAIASAITFVVAFMLFSFTIRQYFEYRLSQTLNISEFVHLYTAQSNIGMAAAILAACTAASVAIVASAINAYLEN